MVRFLILITVLVMIAVGGAITYRHFSFNRSNPQFPREFAERKNLSSELSGGKCQGTGTKEFGSPPMNIADISSVIPMGMMIDAHVTPIDHAYFNPKIFNSPRDKYPVFAIADGTIVDIQHRTSFVGAAHAGQYTNEYRVVIEYTCSFYSYFDLITSLSPDILAKAGNIDDRQKRNGPLRIPIKKGQEIGRIGGQTLDFAVWNNDVTLKGFVNPKSYQGEPWKIHTDDPFKYFKQPIREQLLALDQRSVEPRGGKIDYDIDGKLLGTWFITGSGGYDYARDHRDSFWTTQLSIVYDYLDPTQIRFSIGDYNGKPEQFGVKGNAPDPATIDKNSGLVKYELAQYDYYDQNGVRWERFDPVKNIQSKNLSQVQGVVLVQMLDDRRIKFEVFPGKTANQVSSFDNSVLNYER